MSGPSPRPMPPAPPDNPLIAALLVAGQRLAAALRDENAALAALDLSLAAGLAEGKIRATDAFAAAHAAATRHAARAGDVLAPRIAALAADLSQLGEENRRLLQRAVSIQSRVIETIAAAALPRASGEGTRYGAAGQRAATYRPAAIAVQTRA